MKKFIRTLALILLIGSFQTASISATSPDIGWVYQYEKFESDGSWTEEYYEYG